MEIPLSDVRLLRFSRILIAAVAGLCGLSQNLAFSNGLPDTIRQKFERHCFDCHSADAEEGGFSFDKLGSGQYGEDTQAKWEAVWKNIRAQTMPPAEGESPNPSVRQEWVNWIQTDIFKLQPEKIDPGRVVLRRLNRSEYKETIKLLTGVDFDAREEFPADDTGFGFDTVGESLTLSPVLLEKYLAAASEIVGKFAPLDGPTPPERSHWGNQWKLNSVDGPEPKTLSFEEASTLHLVKPIDKSSRYKLQLLWRLNNAWTFTKQAANLTLSIIDTDGTARVLGEETVEFSSGPDGKLTAELDLPKGDMHLVVDFKPTNSDTKTNTEAVSNLKYQFSVQRLVLVGPLDGSQLEYRESAKKMFFNGPPPSPKDEAEAGSPDYKNKVREHMKVVVRKLGDQAFRRPIDEQTLDRLCDIGMRVAAEPGKRYEHGVSIAMQLILASPRFLYRTEEIRPSDNDPNPTNSELAVRIDDYSLATRMSYFLWGGPPDDALLAVAASGKLHEQIPEQFDRMVKQDWRLNKGIENFVGQWLRTRDVQESQVDARQVLGLRTDEEANKVFDWKVRQAMANETLKMYEYLLTEGRPAEELINARYTFLNEPLAEFYGIEGVKGDQMRKVELSPESHRRGLLTHGSILLVTSNPTRTSPVKRGLFLLETLLGTPAPPAPPNVPTLEESKKGDLQNASLRQILEAHRKEPACASCHQRMDPLGLAMENYNALGQWRPMEKGRPAFRGRPAEPDQPIDPSGKLMSGETFSGVEELAEILADKRREDYYRSLTEKLMTFALGRGLTYGDTTAIDDIVLKVKQDNGNMRTLYKAIITSIPFTHCRKPVADPTLTSN